MIPYPGGKSKISKWITPQFPEDVTKYVEVFGGAFWVYFKWEVTPNVVVYNDLNAQLVNLFSCASGNPSKLRNMLIQYPGENRDVFMDMRHRVFNIYGGMTPNFSQPNYEAAAAYAYLQLHHFIGHRITENLRYQHIDTFKWSSRYQSFINKLGNKHYIHKLGCISKFENSDFEEIISRYDAPDVLFYVDPPYWNTEHYYTEGSFNENDHTRLANVLNNVRGKFALSYYKFNELYNMYPEDRFVWSDKEFLGSMSAGAALAKESSGKSTRKTKVDISKHKATETLIKNY